MRSFSNAASKADLRAFPREQVNRRAKVIGGPFAVDVWIKNISLGGALISFPARTVSGEEVVLIDLETATAYACKVAWRKGAECGVRFTKSQDLRGLVSGQFDMARLVYQAAVRGAA
jgi:hypothetical protein